MFEEHSIGGEQNQEMNAQEAIQNSKSKSFSRFVWFSYHAQDREIRPDESTRFLHMVRDGCAGVMLSSIIQEAGIPFGGVVINMPECWFEQHEAEFEPNPRDLLVLTTRPPLDDPPYGSARAKKVARSDTALERRVLQALRTDFFSFCSRREITLAEHFASLLPKGFEDRFSILFRRDRGGCYEQLGVESKKRQPVSQRHHYLTAGYLTYTPLAWHNNGPIGLVAAFGVSGATTVMFTQFLRAHSGFLRQIIRNSEEKFFLLAEFPVPYRCLDLEDRELMPRPHFIATSFASIDRAKIRIVLQASCPVNSQKPEDWQKRKFRI